MFKKYEGRGPICLFHTDGIFLWGSEPPGEDFLAAGAMMRSQGQGLAGSLGRRIAAVSNSTPVKQLDDS